MIKTDMIHENKAAPLSISGLSRHFQYLGVQKKEKKSKCTYTFLSMYLISIPLIEFYVVYKFLRLVNGMIFKDENVLLNNLEIRMSRVLECLFWWLQILIHYLQNIIVHEFQRTPGCN